MGYETWTETGTTGENDMNHILVIIPTLDTGGSQRAVSNFLTNLPDDYDADIVLNDSKSIVYPYKGNIVDLGLKATKNRSSLLYQIRVFFRRLHVIRKLKKNNQYQAAYSFMDSANIANILTGKKYCKTIVSVRTNLAISGQNSWKYKYLVNPMAKWLYRYADKVVAVSEGVRKELIDVLKFKADNIITIYNGYNLNQIIEASKESLSEDEEKLFEDCVPIMMVGRLCREKAQWNMIRAMKHIVEAVPNSKLFIFGEGSYRQYLETLIREMGISDNVCLMGFQDNPYKFIKRATIFVMTSLYEGFPNSLIEAMALDVPCIATDFKSGAKEILAPDLDSNSSIGHKCYYSEYGIITPICDGVEYKAKESITEEEEMLSEAAVSMLSNDKMREQFITNGKKIVQQFSADAMVKNYLSL